MDNEKLKQEIEKLKHLHAVKSDIVSIGAHQIRTSLSALKWIIKMFLDGDLGKLTTDQENLMKKAYDSSNRAVSIVSELLLINRTEDIVEKKYEFADFDIIELIENAIFDFSGEAHAHKMEIIFLKPENKIPLIKADKEKLRVVFQNLIENAIKYSDHGGKIFLALKEENNMLEISIKDTGIGISEEGKNRIFEKFYRDPEARKKEVIGSGIGLFTSKKIIENHGGKIWFSSEGKSASGGESSGGESTTFFFTIPFA